jgi:4-amino-4-deoxy-L-arabinose transferase-like glycosyltransferase
VRLRQYFGCPSYWYDEAYFIVNIFHRSWAQLLGAIEDCVVAPPVYLWLLRGVYLWGGSSEYAMRLPALIAGLAGLLLIIALAYRLCGSPGWIWAAGFCAVSKHAAMHSNEVRSYTIDFVFTLLVIFAAWNVLLESKSERQSSRLWALFALAIAAPWFSFSSVFILGGVSLAMFVSILGERTWAAARVWLAFNLILGISVFGLWYYDARHLYYPGLEDHWTRGWGAFPPRGSWVAIVRWMGEKLIGIGNYGMDGMGWPVWVVALVGLGVWWRRSRAVALLLIAPIPLTAIAALLRRYPLADRPVFFLLPCLWLLAATGIGACIAIVPQRRRLVGTALLIVFLLPSGIGTARKLVTVDLKVDYRSALDFVQSHRTTDDRLWVQHPQMYETYFGRDMRIFGSYDWVPEIVAQTRNHRLWMVICPGPELGRDTDLLLCLQGPAFHIEEAYRALGVRVLMIEPTASISASAR